MQKDPSGPNGVDAFRPNDQKYLQLDQFISPTELLVITEIYYGHVIDVGSAQATYKLNTQQLGQVHQVGEGAAGLWNKIEFGRHANKVDSDDASVQVLYADGHVAGAKRQTEVATVGDANSLGDLDVFNLANRLFYPLHGADVNNQWGGQ